MDKPYVSAYLQDTLVKMGIPVLNNSKDEEFLQAKCLNMVTDKDSLCSMDKESPLILYCNSENSLHWINSNLGNTELPEKIDLFKDKIKFRKQISSIYTTFFFKEVEYGKLAEVNISKIRKPFIIKPAVGFLSMGVYKVNNDNEWMNTIKQIQTEMEKVKGMFPIEVMDSSHFIIEECINGDEYAIDAYFNSSGKPVVLNIFKHSFSSENDVGDRLYYTSKKIMKQYLERFQEILATIGKLCDLKNFPVHMEVRVDKNEMIVPIEINPMRFAGWCTTDIAHYAYGINVYEYYFNQKEPDWYSILKEDDNRLCCLILADIPKDVKLDDIQGVNYNDFICEFDNLFELRKIDYKKYPLFAFVFASVPDSISEINKILCNDLRKFIVCNN